MTTKLNFSLMPSLVISRSVHGPCPLRWNILSENDSKQNLTNKPSFTRGLSRWSSGQTLVCSLILMFHLWEKTLKDERHHYLYWISGSAQGLATTATLPRCCHRCLLFCGMSYLLIYSSLLNTRILISPIKTNPHVKISTLARQRGRNRAEMVSLHLPSSH